MTSSPKAERPVVRGAEIVFDEFVHDETFGVPAEAAAQVAAQILQALAERSIDPKTVVFSGYYDGENPHEGKESGEFGSNPLGPADVHEHYEVPDKLRLSPDLQAELDEYAERIAQEDRADAPSRPDLLPGQNAYTYFFSTADMLPDGEEGPLAHAATGENPAIGVYSLDRLRAIGYSTLYETVLATPDEIDQALILEFRPTYRQPEE